ncbi:hypothetical protein HZB78_01935 [Candidatus Collierbacteria bacterium]|nr:hypothetical protein [Candidatus Collierbacteria bacterium]
MAEIKIIIHQNRLAALLVLLLTIIFMTSLATIFKEKRIAQLWETRRDKEDKLEKLVELSIQYPDYRDLLYRLAISQSELGNDEAAKEAFARARYLDPNNETLIKIADSLGISLSN